MRKRATESAKITVSFEIREREKKLYNYFLCLDLKKSVWDKFTQTIGHDLITHMQLPGLSIPKYLPAILAAYQDDHPETV